jgi:mono/diheme cytochrome c family protein
MAVSPFAACQVPGEAERQSVKQGYAVAQQRCSGCHQISRNVPPEPAQSRPSWARGPSFIQIAQNPDVDREYLHGLASEFYFPMPAFHLNEKDQEDVISYILSIKSSP